ncbi:MAG: hypothetical protein A2428_03105 [Bdellovibrionales bacterium RIFOXYC1_FULL_54_43]|nr:MAG: hypothetical protein A2428_03105 [Bdellovibrionales bacterium RIFOXYC1_FULL_54_43]OFZ82669.1 MAG: hypothetical protein A2603_02540 [Bdellovibrionales bacterium RIFOXYD1_FULL_55_31]
MDWSTLSDGVLSRALNTFGTPVSYTPNGGDEIQISGVFSNAHILVEVGGVPQSMTAPTLGIRLADLPAKPTKDDQITIKGLNYRITDSQEDGEGGTTLILNQV